MDYKQLMIEELRQYRGRVAGVDSIKQQLAEIDAELADSATDEERRLSLIVLREHLRTSLSVVASQVSRMAAGLATLSDTDRKLLELFYIDRKYGHVDAACELLFVDSYSAVYLHKDAALKRLTVACYGMTEI